MMFTLQSHNDISIVTRNSQGYKNKTVFKYHTHSSVSHYNVNNFLDLKHLVQSIFFDSTKGSMFPKVLKLAKNIRTVQFYDETFWCGLLYSSV